MTPIHRWCGGLLVLAVTLAAPWLVRGAEPGPAATRIGDEACLECHAQYASAWSSVRHNRYLRREALKPEQRGCEGCHGPGSQHLQDPNFRSIKNEKRLRGLAAVQPCLQCHEADVKAASWLQTEHSRAGVTCWACHDVHQAPGYPAMLRKPKQELCVSCHVASKIEFKMNSHHPVEEGRQTCTDCHDPHQEGLGTRQLLKNSQDRCLRCHLEKRGPFVYEHQTATGAGEDNCLTCHRAHGSANPKLLELNGRAVCLQCHSEIGADPRHRARQGNCWSAGCHVRVHGSNRDRLYQN